MIDALIFTGGGIIKCLTYVGALEKYGKYENIDNVKHIGGIRASGSIVATLLASNHTIEEMNEILYNVNWNKLKDSHFGFIWNPIRLFIKYGYHKGSYFERFINKVLFDKYKIENMTFKQLFEITNKHLKLLGTNITQGKTVYMDYIHTPDMSIAKAVRISSSTLLMFKPVKMDNELYVDGGLTKNLSFGIFDEIDKINNIIAFDLDETYPETNNRGLKAFIHLIINRINYETKSEVQINKNVYICKIFEERINPTRFNLTKEEKDYLKEVGYNAFCKILGF